MQRKVIASEAERLSASKYRNNIFKSPVTESDRPTPNRSCFLAFPLGRVNGQWLYKTRQIVTGRNKHPARWMLWRPNRRAQIPSALRSAKPIRWRIR
jgi:hypothetical protein